MNWVVLDWQALRPESLKKYLKEDKNLSPFKKEEDNNKLSRHIKPG